MKDTYLHKGRRKQLLEYIKGKGVASDEVLYAMDNIPRHIFLENVFQDFAYEDRAFPIEAGQTISHPSTVAEQTTLLDLQQGEKVLEIGTGSGYQTAVLVQMKTQVFTIERQKSLFDFSKNMLESLDLKPQYQTLGDGFLGIEEFAPYDKILVTCGASELPISLLRQLKVGGIMVIPIGRGEEQTLTRFTKTSENQVEKEEFGLYKFVPMLPQINS